MTSLIFPFPSTLHTSAAIALKRQLEALAIADEYVFDFAKLGHTEPFGMLYAAALVKEFAEQRHAVISAINVDSCGYQNHMGFFRALGVQHGLQAGEATGGANYLPLTRLSVAALKQEAAAGHAAVGAIVSQRAARISQLLTRTDQGDVYEVLAYSLQEIMRNVVEHSGGPAIEYCLQHWPTKRRVHLAILDTGMGVRASLQANPYLQITSDQDALKLSLMPGVSGKMFKGRTRRAYDIWVNSGYGLYMTSRLSSEAGHFSIFSGSSSLTVGDGRVFSAPCVFNGTAIRVSLDTRHVGHLSARLKQFETEGRQIADNFKDADARGPSLASQMLRARFASEGE
jgi:hypothetical protein